MIPEETIEKVVASSDIVALISSYFPLKRVGTEYSALCPFHAEKTPSFTVSPSRQVYYCFGCGAGGNVTRFLMDYENVDFPTAIRRLAERAGVIIVEETPDAETAARQQTRQRLISLHRDLAEWYHQLLLKKEVAESARQYLRRRGLGIEIAKQWKFGYAPNNTQQFLSWAKEKGYDARLVSQGGFISQSDDGGGSYARFRDRLMFPVCNDYGDVIAFSGRVLQADAAAAKYMNSPETPLFNKSKTLFGLNMGKRAILREGRALVCEGQIDLIMCHAHGIENVVAPLGTAFTEDHARLLKRHTEEVILCFDADNAGYKAAERTFRALMAANVFVRAVLMPPGEDPDSFIREQGADAFRRLLDRAPDFLEFQIARRSEKLNLSAPRDQRQMAIELAENVALVSDKLMQDTMINGISARLGLAAEQFRRTVVDAAREHRREANRQARPEDGQPAPPETFEIVDQTASRLAQVILIDGAVKSWWANSLADYRFLEGHPDAECLRALALANFDPAQASSVAAYLGTLPAARARVLTALLAKPPQGDHERAARDLASRLEQDHLRGQLQAKESKLRRPGLNFQEAQRLLGEIRVTKELLDRLGSPPFGG